MNKQELRRSLKAKRDALSPAQRQEYSRIICAKLLPYLKEDIMSYYPFSSEVDVSAINDTCKVLIPHCISKGEMAIYYYDPAHLKANPYGFREPDPDFCLKGQKENLAVVIVPLLGFDEHRHRLGHGQGFYDRFLKDLHALKIGVAYEIQKTDSIPVEEYDIDLDLIISEKNIYR